jgi:hypothetical protein
MGIAAEQLEAFLGLKEKTPPAEQNVFLDRVPEEAARELSYAFTNLGNSISQFGVEISVSISEGFRQFRL